MKCENCKSEVISGIYINDVELKRHIVCEDCYAKMEVECY